ncbi:MAG: hypothetical protein ACQESC_00040 [Nanobdellota archaeon]
MNKKWLLPLAFLASSYAFGQQAEKGQQGKDFNDFSSEERNDYLEQKLKDGNYFGLIQEEVDLYNSKDTTKQISLDVAKETANEYISAIADDSTRFEITSHFEVPDSTACLEEKDSELKFNYVRDTTQGRDASAGSQRARPAIEITDMDYKLHPNERRLGQYMNENNISVSDPALFDIIQQANKKVGNYESDSTETEDSARTTRSYQMMVGFGAGSANQKTFGSVTLGTRLADFGDWNMNASITGYIGSGVSEEVTSTETEDMEVRPIMDGQAYFGKERSTTTSGVETNTLYGDASITFEKELNNGWGVYAGPQMIVGSESYKGQTTQESATNYYGSTPDNMTASGQEVDPETSFNQDDFQLKVGGGLEAGLRFDHVSVSGNVGMYDNNMTFGGSINYHFGGPKE